jgi:ferredoxin-thioredoxin reductase catalytic subunit
MKISLIILYLVSAQIVISQTSNIFDTTNILMGSNNMYSKEALKKEKLRKKTIITKETLYFIDNNEVSKIFYDSILLLKTGVEKCTPCHLIYYDNNKNTRYTCDCYYDQPIGKVQIFDESGNLLVVRNFKSNLIDTNNIVSLPHGEWYYYKENKIVFIEKYDNGVLKSDPVPNDFKLPVQQPKNVEIKIEEGGEIEIKEDGK